MQENLLIFTRAELMERAEEIAGKIIRNRKLIRTPGILCSRRNLALAIYWGFRRHQLNQEIEGQAQYPEGEE